MHCPGHFIGRVITATGVTPDIVLANFFMLCHKQSSRFQLMATTKNPVLMGSLRGANAPLNKKSSPSPLKK